MDAKKNGKFDIGMHNVWTQLGTASGLNAEIFLG